ncbi:hypothetical protein PR001_g28779 [Phytophthora rubi]|uniref:CCHC-type domain-containing protein n=1 Tax=Phytophthora rubi TaxID=129364 RepID=A0A6A3H6H3_9STRA|nr:hypothetical protein PR001_g28779 [Phytophthora rubi]
MTTLTPSRTKAATKSGKKKRVTRRQTKDLLMQTPETPTALNEERTPAVETARRTADASPTPDEHRADEPTAAAPATEMAALASALYRLTTVVAGLQARTDEGGQPSTPRATRNDGRAGGTEVTVTQDVSAATTSRTGTEGQTAATPELAAMATAMEQLATMVARLQPAVAGREGGDQQPAARAPRQRATRARTTPGAPDDGDSSDLDSSASDSSDGDSTESDRSDDDGSADDESGDGFDEGGRGRSRRGARQEHRRRRERRERQPRRKSVKDLELPTFTPSPKVSVSTWIDRVDLALKGAEESGRGKWSDSALYCILGNKLMENAARWWVNMNRQLPKRKRTWSNLKKGLLRRYGEKKDKSAAEWRVSMRPMMPGETYADFAAGLRDVVGRNHAPKPKTLEEAVDKATEINNPMDNVAQGMLNVGLPWATAPRPYLIPMTGTMGQTMVIPGIGGPGLPTDMTSTTGVQGDVSEAWNDMEHAALFTNPQGVYNAVTGTWDPPPGHQRNGKYWYEPKKTERKRAAAASPASGRAVAKKTVRPKPKRETVESSSDESDVKPKKKKLKAAVKQAAGDKRRVEEQAPEEKRSGKASRPNSGVCFQCGQPGHWSTQCPNEPKCFACNQPGHFARACTDPDAKARNDVYMQQRGRKLRAAPEN